ncbi:MAG: DEAD/DEAH box helicase [Verrucomicrobia bacterium]|nr:DEAD/DEAH box helicase [Verrucomicrobiota bacterium]
MRRRKKGRVPISLSPQGRLHFDETAAADLDARLAEILRQAAAQSSAHVLLSLATRALDAPLAPAGVFWRELGRRFFTQLCHTPELAATVSLAPPPDVELAALADAAPPMPGAEYLRPETLRTLWGELDALVFSEIRAGGGGAQAWLKTQNPLWNLVGRVTFHLAENKRDPERPFAFLATYTHRISEQARPQYLPLGRALQEYAGARNRAALLALLAPVQRAAEKSPLARELVDSQRVFQPQAWTPREAHRFLRDIPLFEDSGLLVRIPDWWKAGRPSRPTVSVTVGGVKTAGLGLDALLDFKVALTLDGEAIGAEEWARIAATDAGLVLLKGRWVEVDRAKLQTVLDHWRTLEAARKQGGVSFADGLRLLAGAQPGAGAPEAAEADVRTWSSVRAGDWFEKTLAELRHPSAPAAGAGVPGLQAALRPYQSVGVHWLRFLTKLGLGACLADDMGLGKTVQVLAALLHWRDEQPGAAPALLVLPASLLGNWQSEAARFAPTLRLLAAHPSETDADTLAATARNPDAALAGVDLVLTTYGMLLKQEWLRRRAWSLVILDEAQAIKNPGARQTRAVKELKAPVRIALTGTPVENSLGDLWSLFDFLNPGLLGSAGDFSRYTKRLAQSMEPGPFAPLRQLVRPYILRRLKSDRSVIADLPDKTEMRAFCGLTRRQAILYQQAVEELAEKLASVEGIERRGVVLATLMRLKQLCNHPAQWLGGGDYDPAASGKFQRLAELAGEIAARQEKALVFTQFREMTGPLQHFLAGIFQRPGLVLHGGTRVKERGGLVAQFQREDGPPFFLLSLKAGGTGLNLTEAGHVIHFDRWWNPAVENQATDRAYRIGQKKNVLVHKFVCRGTVEEKIDRLIADKQSLAADVLADGGEIPLTEMRDDELLKFVSLDLKAASSE